MTEKNKLGEIANKHNVSNRYESDTKNIKNNSNKSSHSKNNQSELVED